MAASRHSQPAAVEPGRREPYALGWDAITAAEMRVIRLVVRGWTNQEIAARLYLSPHTVTAHVRHVLRKLDQRSRVDITRVALRHDPSLAGNHGTDEAA